MYAIIFAEIPIGNAEKIAFGLLVLCGAIIISGLLSSISKEKDL